MDATDSCFYLKGQVEVGQGKKFHTHSMQMAKYTEKKKLPSVIGLARKATATPFEACTKGVPKVTNNFFLHAHWEQQTKESAVVDETSCCVILECLVTSIACIT